MSDAHASALLQDLAQAPVWDPRPTLARLATFPADDITAAVQAVDGLRIGSGAVSMLRRTERESPRLAVAGLQDFEAVLLAVACLRAGRTLTEPAPIDLVARTPDRLADLLRREPDLFDVLLLKASVRMHNDPALLLRLSEQCALLDGAAGDLHAQIAPVLPPRRTVKGVLRGLIGAGPDLSDGLWVRWLRAGVVALLLATSA